jgi:hypothetical protein
MARTFSLEAGSNVVNGTSQQYKDAIKAKQTSLDRQTPLPSPDNILARAEPR